LQIYLLVAPSAWLLLIRKKRFFETNKLPHHHQQFAKYQETIFPGNLKQEPHQGFFL
jgi:hypothetical protein